MAWVFNGSSQGLRADSGVASFPVNPVAMGCWALLNNLTDVHSMFSAVGLTTNNRNELIAIGTATGDPLGFAQSLSGAYDRGEKAPYISGAWAHYGGEVNSSNINRLAYVNGVAGIGNNTSIQPTGIDRIRIGHYNTNAETYGWTNGRVTYPWIAKIDISSTQWAQLAAHRHPRRVFNVATELYALWTFQTSGGLTDEITGIVLAGQGSPTWEANPCNICTASGINPTAVVAGSSYNLEGDGINDAQGAGILELCNNAVYGSATIKVTQTITAWADDRITFTAVRGGLSAGTVYAFITPNAGASFRSPAYAVTLSGTDPGGGSPVVIRRRRD